MTVTLYNTDENPKVLSKTLTDGVSIGDCAPYEPISDLTGSVLVPYTQTAEQCNYAMLVFTDNNVNFTKYYYITDRQLEVGKKMRLYLKTDVLKTYDEQIRKCKAVFDRCENADMANVETADSYRRIEADQELDYWYFNVVGGGSGFTYPNRVIAVCSV